ncbi:MAG: hypothetical protein EPN85_07260 [Bacteroidetes bacterium]|nr:MAG: hypothetical protein EPN85_07260 [Bacteroidota bacterium]
MKKYLLLLTASLSFTVAYGQTTFQKTFGTTASEKGYSISQTQDKGYILLSPADNGSYAYVVKTDSVGNKIWSENISGQYPRNIIQMKDGGYILSGGLANNPAYLIKLTSAGNINWQWKYTYSFGINYFNYVKDDLDGTGFVTTGEDNNDKLFLVKLTASGNVIWATSMEPPVTNPHPRSGGFVQSKLDSSFYVLSTYRIGGSNEGIILAKFSKNGNGMWPNHFQRVECIQRGLTEICQ